MNVYPGQGLGSTPSRLIAFGLGGDLVAPDVEDVVVIPVGGGGGFFGADEGFPRVFRGKVKARREDIDRAILEDDDEVLLALINIITSGVLN